MAKFNVLVLALLLAFSTGPLSAKEFETIDETNLDLVVDASRGLTRCAYGTRCFDTVENEKEPLDTAYDYEDYYYDEDDPADVELYLETYPDDYDGYTDHDYDYDGYDYDYDYLDEFSYDYQYPEEDSYDYAYDYEYPEEDYSYEYDDSASYDDEDYRRNMRG